MKKNLILLISFLSFTTLFAQRPGGRPPGGGPETMIAREKQAVLDKITDLNEDQELLLDGIYDEFTVTLKETFQESRESGSREGMREKMQALRSEKDDLIKDVLNEEQFKIYQTISQRKRERRESSPVKD